MKRTEFLSPRTGVIAGMILTAAAARLFPHPPNFTPIAAMALFAGARLSDKRAALAIPIAAMLLSDAVIGFHAHMPAVYASFAAIALIGMRLRTRAGSLPVLGASLAGSALFFVATNFAVWAAGGGYPKTVSGLLACYRAAIPFFGNTVLGDLTFNACLFGGFAMAQMRFPILREPAPARA